ncbi:hypothetical protein D3C81_953960 [compost metagenome]
MGFAREHELNPAGFEVGADQVRPGEDQITPFIRRGTAREPDQQPVRIQRGSRALADQIDQLALEFHMRGPYIAAFIISAEHPRIGPGRQVDRVRDPDDLRPSGHVLPHTACGLRMQGGNGVRAARKPQTGDGHVKRVAADPLHLVAGQPVKGGHRRKQIQRMGFVAFLDRRMGRKDDRFAGVPPGRFEGESGLHFLADQLRGGQGGVPFVEMINLHRDAQRAKRLNPPDT